MTNFDGFLTNNNAVLINFVSVYDNDPYLQKFTEDSSDKKEVVYKTTFNGILSNTEDYLKCTLTEFKSIYENDLYLSNFKETIKNELEEFLE
jgi:hypothetical protein